jgi:hypothetical protein
MDGSKFDRLAQAIGSGGSRRRLLGTLTALGFGAALTGLEADNAGAEKPKDRLRRRTRQHRRKRRNEKRRNQGNSGNGARQGSDQCPATGPDCAGKTCGPDGCGGSCGSCLAGWQDCCAGTCKDIFIDHDNCGACGSQCPGAATCANGSCCVVKFNLPWQCSATMPCCQGICREDGSCCLPLGEMCTHSVECCSGLCGPSSKCS